MDTKVRSVIYQHLIAQICILEQDTIGYNFYYCLVPTLFGQSETIQHTVIQMTHMSISEQYQQTKGLFFY